MVEIAGHLSDIDGLTVEELLALGGHASTKLNHSRAVKELGELIRQGFAMMQPGTRIDDAGRSNVRPTFKRRSGGSDGQG